MNIGDAVLLPGETLQLSKNSNAIITLAEYGLERLPGDQLTSIIGLSGKKVLDGELHLTNFRLIFKSHPFNRRTGSFSIWLPTVHDIRDTSSLVVQKCCVSTGSQEMEFLLWDAHSFVQAVNSARVRFGIEQTRVLAEYIRDDPQILSTGSMISRKLDQVVRHHPDAIVKSIAEICEDPISVSTMLNIIELIEIFAENGDM